MKVQKEDELVWERMRFEWEKHLEGKFACCFLEQKNCKFEKSNIKENKSGEFYYMS